MRWTLDRLAAFPTQTVGEITTPSCCRSAVGSRAFSRQHAALALHHASQQRPDLTPRYVRRSVQDNLTTIGPTTGLTLQISCNGVQSQSHTIASRISGLSAAAVLQQELHCQEQVAASLTHPTVLPQQRPGFDLPLENYLELLPAPNERPRLPGWVVLLIWNLHSLHNTFTL